MAGNKLTMCSFLCNRLLSNNALSATLACSRSSSKMKVARWSAGEGRERRAVVRAAASALPLLRSKGARVTDSVTTVRRYEFSSPNESLKD